MMRQSDEELCNLALRKWGNNKQLMMTIEECAELQKAICKLIRVEVSPEEYHKNILALVEECVDVEWMLKQVETMLGQPSDWRDMRALKREHLIEILNEKGKEVSL